MRMTVASSFSRSVGLCRTKAHTKPQPEALSNKLKKKLKKKRPKDLMSTASIYRKRQPKNFLVKCKKKIKTTEEFVNEG